MAAFIVAILAGVLTVMAGDAEQKALKAFADYDAIMQKRAGGTLDANDSIAMQQNLKAALAGFRQWRQEAGGAEMPDELAKAIGAHYNDFTVAGIFMFQARDYAGAYDIWEACVELPDNPAVAEAVKNPQNPRGLLAVNRALAATQAAMYPEALAAYDKAFALGYDDRQLFDSAVTLSQQTGDNADALKWACRGAAKYGRNSVYREYEIKYTTEIDPAKGVELATESIGENPGEARWYNMRVIAYERLKRNEDALADLRKVTELTPADPMAWYNYGNKLLYMANLGRNGNTLDKNAYKTALNEAAEALEQAVKCSTGERKSMHAVVKSLNFLDQIYAQTNDKAGKKRVADYRAKFGMTK